MSDRFETWSFPSGRTAVIKVDDSGIKRLSRRYNKSSAENEIPDNSDTYRQFMDFVDPFGAYRCYMRFWGVKL